MKPNFDHTGIKIEKDSLKERIVAAVNRQCTNNPQICCFGYCTGNVRCHKNVLAYENLNLPRRKLKGILKNLTKHENKKSGRRNPKDEGNTLYERIKFILGESIFEHELITGAVKKEINRCTTMNQVIRILYKRHFAATGRKKFLPK